METPRVGMLVVPFGTDHPIVVTQAMIDEDNYNVGWDGEPRSSKLPAFKSTDDTWIEGWEPMEEFKGAALNAWDEMGALKATDGQRSIEWSYDG